MANSIKKTANKSNFESSKNSKLPIILTKRTELIKEIVAYRKQVAELDDNFLTFVYDMFVDTLLQPFNQDDRFAILESSELIKDRGE